MGASKVARNITQRKAAEALLKQQTERLEALNRVAKTIASDLDIERIVQRVTDLATELTGAQFGAFFYNVTPTFHGSGVVRSDDIRNDPRYGRNAPHHGMPKGHLPVVSYLAVPVIGRSGEVIGGLFFGHHRSGVFTQGSEHIAVGIASHAAIAIQNARLYRTAQEESQSKELLLKEFKHRIKNTLATVQAIASQTLRSSPQSERDAFGARLQALAHAHDLLTDRDWQQATVRNLVQRALAPFEQDCLVVDGPDAALDASKALHLTMALHELATMPSYTARCPTGKARWTSRGRSRMTGSRSHGERPAAQRYDLRAVWDLVRF